jgi:predicted lipid-binding transport protein (Tim44 family)
MMRNWLLAACVALVGSALVATDVEARRLGGARSLGAQRNIANAPPAKPAQQQAAPAQNAPQAATRGGKWGPVLGGLTLGGLLGYLFAGNGLAGILVLAALAFAAVMLFRALARRAGPAQRRIQFAGAGKETVVAPAPAPPLAAALSLPAGFDAAGFLRAAKFNFVKLQVANDAGQLDEIRELTTGEMFDALSRDFEARSPQPQDTAVVALKADLLELVSEKDRYWASVHFSGMVRETPGTAPAAFEEVWNLVKPTDGSSGWLLAGIQQMH